MFLKEEWVRVVPGLKQIMHQPPQEEVWLHWLTRQMVQKILVIIFFGKNGKKIIPYLFDYKPSDFYTN